MCFQSFSETVVFYIVEERDVLQNSVIRNNEVFEMAHAAAAPAVAGKFFEKSGAWKSLNKVFRVERSVQINFAANFFETSIKMLASICVFEVGSSCNRRIFGVSSMCNRPFTRVAVDQAWTLEW